MSHFYLQHLAPSLAYYNLLQLVLKFSTVSYRIRIFVLVISLV